MKESYQEYIISIFVYVIGVFFLTVYGVQVCPFLEGLGKRALAQELIIVCLLGYLLRSIWFTGLQSRFHSNKKLSLDRLRLPVKLFFSELFIWFIVGVIIALFHQIAYGGPIFPSGIKVIYGTAVIGFYSAAFVYLRSEYVIIRSIEHLDGFDLHSQKKEQSVTARMLLIFSVSFAVIFITLLLVVYKDLDWINKQLEINNGLYNREFLLISIEITYIFSAVIMATYLVLHQQVKNFRLMFSIQRKALEAIEEGDYSTKLPVVMRNEFGLFAEKINKMVEGLKEKEFIREQFGKYVNSGVAEHILNEKSALNFKGSKVDVCVMFTDIRNYTTISESLVPEELVALLNRYFSLLVTIIHDHEGAIDKFIGDATLSVFGLQNSKKGCSEAIQAAIRIQKELRVFNERLAIEELPPFNTGIGIHFGSVIAGNIGSKERVEYTVIGDVVNTASRLESLSKTFKHSVLLSQETYQNLTDREKESFVFIDSCPIKGKDEKVEIYGLILT